jgi:hypothetical protein
MDVALTEYGETATVLKNRRIGQCKVQSVKSARPWYLFLIS